MAALPPNGPADGDRPSAEGPTPPARRDPGPVGTPARVFDPTAVEPERAKEMSFIEHLEELRWHIVRAGIAVLAVMVAAFLSKRLVFDYLIFAPKHPDFLSYRALCWAATELRLGDRFCLTPPEFAIANLRMLGEFLAHLRVSFFLGLVLAFPYVLWEFWKFVRPGLYAREVHTTRGIVGWCSLLFALGVGFGYFIIVPFSINFLVPYSISDAVADYIQLDDYISFITMIVLAAGVLFELPVVIYFLARLGIVGPEFLKAHRRHAAILILFVSAVITPPDVTSQILIGLPVMLLYEVGIGIARRVERRRERELAG
jgi:sec-independent protein translocase protein TatC